MGYLFLQKIQLIILNSLKDFFYHLKPVNFLNHYSLDSFASIFSSLPPCRLPALPTGRQAIHKEPKVFTISLWFLE